MSNLSEVSICLSSMPHQYVPDSRPCVCHGSDATKLIVFDLYHTQLSYPDFDFDCYNQIWDIYLLERLANLGVNHRHYTGQDVLQSNLLCGVGDLSKGETIPMEMAERILSYCIKLVQRLKERGGWGHYCKIELPFAISLSRVSRHGVTVDKHKADLLLRCASTTRNKLVNQLRRAGIEQANPDGLKQWLLYSDNPEKLRLARSEQAIDYKSKASLDPVFEIFKRLDKLERGHRLVANLHSGKTILHPSYRTLGAETGRCTSRQPNVMALPKELRPIVIPHASDWGIVEIDYCQMEVGIIGALAEDARLIDDFNSGDVYQRLSHHLHTERRVAKQVFLSLLYGVGITTLSQWLGEANHDYTRAMIDQFFLRYPELKRYLNGLVSQGRNYGYVASVTGLRRYVNSARKGRLSPARIHDWEENWFKNYPVQGSSAAVFKAAIINISRHVSDNEFRLLVPMYDSIVFEAPLKRLQHHIDLVSTEMVTAMRQYFPVLTPRVDINAHEPGSWNSTSVTTDFKGFLANPLEGVPPIDRPADDWLL